MVQVIVIFMRGKRCYATCLDHFRNIVLYRHLVYLLFHLLYLLPMEGARKLMVWRFWFCCVCRRMHWGRRLHGSLGDGVTAFFDMFPGDCLGDLRMCSGWRLLFPYR